MSKIPNCEKCGGEIKEDLICVPCRREYTWLWVQLRQKGER